MSEKERHAVYLNTTLCKFMNHISDNALVEVFFVHSGGIMSTESVASDLFVSSGNIDDSNIYVKVHYHDDSPLLYRKEQDGTNYSRIEVPFHGLPEPLIVYVPQGSVVDLSDPAPFTRDFYKRFLRA